MNSKDQFYLDELWRWSNGEVSAVYRITKISNDGFSATLKLDDNSPTFISTLSASMATLLSIPAWSRVSALKQLAGVSE